jgi:hypothetical protein
MVRIEIKGANLGESIEITDPRIREFTPWAGPGAQRQSGRDLSGFRNALSHYRGGCGLHDSHGGGQALEHLCVCAACDIEVSTAATFAIAPNGSAFTLFSAQFEHSMIASHINLTAPIINSVTK